MDWQQAILGNYCLGKWLVLVDVDEFLTYPDVANKPLRAMIAELDASGCDGARAMLVDMYLCGPLEDCDFSTGQPFDLAP